MPFEFTSSISSMNPLTVAIIAVICYFIGAISFARIIVRRYAPEKNVEEVTVDIVGTDKKMKHTTIGASSVGMILGPKMGMLAGMLDMLKAILPVLAVRLIFPGQPYVLVAALATSLGHILPVYYRFRGGAGYSTLFGSFFVISPLGATICALGGLLLGLFVFRNFPILYALQFLLMIPWMAYEFKDLAYIYFAIIASVLFFIGWIPAGIAVLKAGKSDHRRTMRDMMDQYPMGKPIIKFADKIHLNID